MKYFYCVAVTCGSLVYVSIPTLAQDNRGTTLVKGDLHFGTRYEEIISSATITQHGLFDIHQADGNYYFELPEKILEKEILIVSRISGSPHKFSAFGAGVYTKLADHQVVRFQRRDNLILMRLVVYDDMADQNHSIYESVRSNNFEPIVYSFKIEAIEPNLSSYVIDVTDFFTSDVPLIGIHGSDFGLSGVDKSRSMICSVEALSTNIEIEHILTYKASKLHYEDRNNTLSFKMNQSFALLPEDRMMPRLYDERVGFFTIERTNYSDEQEAKKTKFITRWKLVPSDWQAYKNGELVEPIKSIVYYIDPATPIHLRPYIKKGVEDWQKPFERIGFKKAILAKELDESNSGWDINDFRYSVIRYVANESTGAAGLNVHDPRTGEILKADIQLSHNMMLRKKCLFLIQTAASNPLARSINFNTEVLGELVRSVVAHEIGHTLGLEHCDDASRAYPVDSLRSPYFTSDHGNASSIMDYAWGNYVAQPGDGVTKFYNRIGEYDYWAIKYGYKPIPNMETPEEEEAILNKWIVDEVDNQYVRFPKGMTGNMDIGDDPFYASELGIKNLKLIREHLIQWTEKPGDNYTNLNMLYEALFQQFERCLDPVRRIVGGYYYRPKTTDEEGSLYQFTSYEMQKRAISFLDNHLFQTPYWLIDREILMNISPKYSGVKIVNRIAKIQQGILIELLKDPISMVQNEALNGTKAYTTLQLYEDLGNEIFRELKSNAPIDFYRRNLQKIFINEVSKHANQEMYKYIDVSSVARANLIIWRKEMQGALVEQRDRMSKYHLEDLIARIDCILNAQE